jgi:hypothetical protein
MFMVMFGVTYILSLVSTQALEDSYRNAPESYNAGICFGTGMVSSGLVHIYLHDIIGLGRKMHRRLRPSLDQKEDEFGADYWSEISASVRSSLSENPQYSTAPSLGPGFEQDPDPLSRINRMLRSNSNCLDLESGRVSSGNQQGYRRSQSMACHESNSSEKKDLQHVVVDACTDNIPSALEPNRSGFQREAHEEAMHNVTVHDSVERVNTETGMRSARDDNRSQIIVDGDLPAADILQTQGRARLQPIHSPSGDGLEERHPSRASSRHHHVHRFLEQELQQPSLDLNAGEMSRKDAIDERTVLAHPSVPSFSGRHHLGSAAHPGPYDILSHPLFNPGPEIPPIYLHEDPAQEREPTETSSSDREEEVTVDDRTGANIVASTILHSLTEGFLIGSSFFPRFTKGLEASFAAFLHSFPSSISMVRLTNPIV